MAKQRNSLGFAVLPLTGGYTLSWEEYKKKYGVDLEEIFEVQNISGDPDAPIYAVNFKTSFSKIIALSYNIHSLTLEVPPVSTPRAFGHGENADKSRAFISMTVFHGDFDSGYHLLVNANKTIMGGDI